MQFRTQAFPWCPVASTSVGSGTLHPGAVSIAQLAEWYWRVKFWTVTIVSATATYTFNDKQLVNELYGAPSNERELICVENIVTGSKVFKFSDIFTAGGSPSVVIRFELFIFSDFLTPDAAIGTAANPGTTVATDSMHTDEGFYYPQILFRSTVDDSGSGEFDASTWNAGLPWTLSAIDFSIDGVSFPIYSQTSTEYISASITPQEWWPYAPESDPGTPVWDAATGAQLNPVTVSD